MLLLDLTAVVMPFDISKLPESWVKQLILGLIPGGTLLIGLSVTHVDQTEKLLHYSQLDGPAKLALALFGAYVAGFVLLSFGAALVILFHFGGYAVGYNLSRRTSNTIDASRNVVWRRLVTVCLASTPVVRMEEPSVSDEERKRRIQETIRASAQDPDLVVKVATVAATEVYRAELDTEWRYLYSVLQCYFYEKPSEDVWSSLSTLYGLSIAFMVWAAYPFPSAWPFRLFVLCALVATALSVYFGLGQAVSEPTDGILGARILREWKAPKPPQS